MQSTIDPKRIELTEQVAKHVQEFLRSGGKVYECRQGESAEQKYPQSFVITPERKR